MCECGDQTGDGLTDMNDIMAIVDVAFGRQEASPLCDTNDDDECNVLDVLGVHAKMFGEPAYCAKYPESARVCEVEPPGPCESPEEWRARVRASCPKTAERVCFGDVEVPRRLRSDPTDLASPIDTTGRDFHIRACLPLPLSEVPLYGVTTQALIDAGADSLGACGMGSGSRASLARFFRRFVRICSPSSRYSRTTRFAFTRQPSLRRSTVSRR
jgi:hypothetical protein